MRRLLIAALGSATALMATPALADPPGGVSGGVVDACTALYVQGAIACQGYYGGNLFNGAVNSLTDPDVLTAIGLLLNGTASTLDSAPTNNTAAYNPPPGGYPIDVSHILAVLENQSGTNNVPFNYVFGGPNLSGLTVFGAHFGQQPDAGTQNNISAFWLVDLGAGPTHTVTITNGTGVSNAQIFGTGLRTSVPEPATWAMMLLGFGGIGIAMRRKQRRGGALMQIA